MAKQIPVTEDYLDLLRKKFNTYHELSNSSWELLTRFIEAVSLPKNSILLNNGEVALNMHFLISGALIAYFSDEEGNSYTKNIFLENDLVGSTVSLITKVESNFTIESIEDSILLNIPYATYRNLINTNVEYKNLYIAYLEKNWVIEKEKREVSIVMENATLRYKEYLVQHPGIEKRIPAHHIASNLGITPTQLSRIRKNLK